MQRITELPNLQTYGITEREPAPLVDKIISYEMGDLDEQQTIELFQELVTSGKINGLQGHYQRTASALMSQGLIRSAS